MRRPHGQVVAVTMLSNGRAERSGEEPRLDVRGSQLAVLDPPGRLVRIDAQLRSGSKAESLKFSSKASS
jgi:hypothetical protein